MGLAAHHPEDLRAGLLDDLALLLHRGRVDPVLGVPENDTARAGRAHDAVGARQRVLQQRRLVRAAVEGARERLLHDHVLAGLDRFEGDGLVAGGR
jgi:hypothetical protein